MFSRNVRTATWATLSLLPLRRIKASGVGLIEASHHWEQQELEANAAQHQTLEESLTIESLVATKRPAVDLNSLAETTIRILKAALLAAIVIRTKS